MWDQFTFYSTKHSNSCQPPTTPAAPYMATANSLQNGQDTAGVMLNTASTGRAASSSNDMTGILHAHMRSMFLLRNALYTTSAANHLDFRWKYYPDYTHQTVPLAAEYDGLRFLFDFYYLDFPFDSFYRPDYKDDTLLAGHFDRISRRMGYTVSPPEVFVNNIAYGLPWQPPIRPRRLLFRTQHPQLPQQL